MQKMLANNLRSNMGKRLFSIYNYSAAGNQKVFLEVSKDGASAVKLVFELYDNRSPALALNFAAFCTGTADKHRSYVGTALHAGTPGFAVMGGDLHEEENLGAGCARLPDENLETRHHKRGVLTMVNDGPHANGSQFAITFGETSFLDGYQNVIGELVEGDGLLKEIEDACSRDGNIKGNWTISNAGKQH